MCCWSKSLRSVVLRPPRTWRFSTLFFSLSFFSLSFSFFGVAPRQLQGQTRVDAGRSDPVGKLGEKENARRTSGGLRTRRRRKEEGFKALGEAKKRLPWGNTKLAAEATQSSLGRGILVGRGWPRGGAASEDARQDAGLAPTIERPR